MTTHTPALSEKDRATFERYPGMFLQVERIWDCIRAKACGPLFALHDLADCGVGEMEAELAVSILHELGKVEDTGTDDIRILDHDSISSFAPQSLKPAEPKESYGKVCMLHAAPGSADALARLSAEFTSSVFNVLGSVLTTMEDDRYALTSADPKTGAVTVSFRTIPIGEQEFAYFNEQVDMILAAHQG